MVKISTHLHFNGNTKEAFDFYKSVFGGEFTNVMKFKDVPGFTVSESEAGKIMHIALPLSKDYVLVANDVPEQLLKDKVFVVGNNIDLVATVDSKEEADRVFAGLSAGGVVEASMADAFWGDYFGMLIDKFGINWMVTFPKKG